MATTIGESFEALLTWLTPTEGETSAAKSHRASISQCLTSNFSLNGFFRSGSFGHGTSVRGFSDVDYFAVIPPYNINQNSQHTLSRVHQALDVRFPKTGVAIDAPAIVVPFGNDASESSEIVPAKYVGKINNYDCYEIPDRQGGWIRSSPDAHGAFVDHWDSRHSGALKPLIRFIKAWKYFNHVPISSFYLELYVTHFASQGSNIIWPFDLYRILSDLKNFGLKYFADPMQLSPPIAATNNMTDFMTANAKIQEGIGFCTAAAISEQKNDHHGAIHYWNRFFNGGFPAYG